MDLITEFKENKLRSVIEVGEQVESVRCRFVNDYPYESISSMSMDEYMIAKEGYGNSKSFCSRLRNEMGIMGSMGNVYFNIFGIYLNNGTKITLNGTCQKKFGNEYYDAFKYIKEEILKLLEAAEIDDYDAIANNELNSSFKFRLLMVYFPKKIVPVCTKDTLHEYCKRVGIVCDPKVDMIYWNIALKEWKESVPEISGWSNYVLMRFCDWLWRSDQTIDGNVLRDNISEKEDTVKDGLAQLNLQGEEKEAVIHVRVNQSKFRDLLLRRYGKCCLCNVRNPELLIASHIKPWSESEPKERLDIDNGFLMCPNHDRLFDKGWISFTDEGNIMVSDRLNQVDKVFMNVSDDMKIDLIGRNKEYLKYHREHIFNS